MAAVACSDEKSGKAAASGLAKFAGAVAADSFVTDASAPTAYCPEKCPAFGLRLPWSDLRGFPCGGSLSCSPRPCTKESSGPTVLLEATPSPL